MPYDELLGWTYYFTRRPVEWRDDYRTFTLLQVQGVKGKPGDVFQSLKQVFSPPVSKQDNTISIENLRRSTLFKNILSSTGGDEIPKALYDQS